MKFNIILAVDDKNWLWKNNSLAWILKDDMMYYKKITSQTKDKSKQNALIMWRKTWESIPSKFRPLPGRLNCVLSRDENYSDNWCEVYSSLSNALKNLEQNKNVETIFINGGSYLYNEVLSNPMLDKIYLTKVKWDYDCDVFFDWIPADFKLESESEQKIENDIEYSFLVYKKRD